MRALNLANERKRDAVVGIDGIRGKSRITYVLLDGSPKRNVKILKGTLQTGEDVLLSRYGSLAGLGEEIIKSDPEVDIEKFGRLLDKTKRIYIGRGNRIAYRVNLTELVWNPDGTLKERRELQKNHSNILGEIPLQWSGKRFPKEEAVRKFVFSGKYQIKHVNGLTYDFLYEMAKSLHESNSLMFVGCGRKGTSPVVLTGGGVPYRGFLEGRVKGDKYCLILHLTNLELKGVL